MRLLCALRHFMPRLNFKITCKELGRKDTFSDSNITVTAIPSAREVELPDEENVKKYGNIISRMTEDRSVLEEKLLPVKKKRGVEQTESIVKRHKLELENKFNIVDGECVHIPPPKDEECCNSNVAISYLIRGPDIRGKFYPEKATALGITPGKDFGALASGKPVTNSKGETVYPHQVMDPKIDGFLLLVVDCPSTDNIPHIINEEFYAPFYATPERAGGVLKLVLHALGKGVIHCEKYREWMGRFGTEVKHCVSVEEHKQLNPVYRTSVMIRKVLNYIDPEIYIRPDSPTNSFTFPKEWGLCENYAVCTDFMIYSKLEGSPVVDYSKCLGRNRVSGFLSGEKSSEKLEDYSKLCSEVRKEVCEEGRHEEKLTNDVFVCTLGTGSASPSLSRNVSANLVNCDDLTILLDCGEGTIKQIPHIFNSGDNSPYTLEHILESLRLIYISHAHADHHMGLVGVLEMRKKYLEATNKKRRGLYIISPLFVNNFVKEFSSICGVLTPEVHIIDSSQLSLEDGQFSASSHSVLSPLLSDLGLKSISLVPVNHCRHASAVVIRFSNGRSVAYSGDCRPSFVLAREARECDVFIHEATFEDSSFGLNEAIKKKHCTSSEALEVVNASQCRLSILTHFSQRYPLVPPLVSTLDKVKLLESRRNPYVPRSPIISAASDLMCLRLSQSWRIPYYYSILKLARGHFQQEED